MKTQSDPNRFAIITDPTDEDVKEFQNGFEAFNLAQTNDEFNSPQPWRNLVLKDHEGNVAGGIMTSTLYWTQYLEVLWVDDKYRGLGYGRDLVLEAHRLAKEDGCTSSHVYTFSWQAPDFYQAVGYELIATYVGYHGGITEHILRKRFDSGNDTSNRNPDPTRFKVTEDASEEDLKAVRKGLGRNFDDNIEQLQKEHPLLNYNLITKNDDEEVIGGINGYTTFGTLFIEGIWVDEKYRGQGYGKELLMEAESLARERECIAGQSACFTFQNLEFMRKQGYESYGFTDAYPNDVKEYFLIKKI